MRIAISADFFLPKIDGVVVRTTNIIQCLQKAGNDVLVFCANPGFNDYYGAKIYGLPRVTCPFYLEWKMGLPLPQIRDELKRFKPDIVFVICPVILGLGVVGYAKSLGLPLLISYNTNWDRYLAENGMAYLQKPVMTGLRYLYNLGDLTLTTSNYAAQSLEKQGFNSVRILPAGINTTLFNPQKKSESMRRYLTKDRVNSPLLLFVGRLSAEKKIASIKQMMDALPEVQLAIVGDGPDRPNLEQIFPRDRTQFTGYLQGEELAAAYASSDVFVFTSECETLGFSVIEAMASGCPVVACRAGGVPTIVTHNETGMLYNPNDIPGAIAAIKTLLSQDLIRKEIIHNARQYTENLSWESSTDKLKHYLQDAIQKHRDLN